MKFTNNPIVVLNTSEVTKPQGKNYHVVDLQIFDGDIAGQHRVFGEETELKAIKKGNYLVDIEPRHGDYAAVQYTLTNFRPATAQAPKA